jgi:hypothetical protein
MLTFARSPLFSIAAVLLLTAAPIRLAGSEAVTRRGGDGQPAQAAPSASGSGRTFVLVIDTLSLPANQTNPVTSTGMQRLFDSLIQSGDRAAIVAVGNRLRVVTDFSSDRGELRAGLTRVVNAARSASADIANPNAQDTDLRGLADACSMLAQASKRKAVVYFAGNNPFGFPAGNASQRIGDRVYDPFATPSRVSTAAPNCATANVAIYVIDPSTF